MKIELDGQIDGRIQVKSVLTGEVFLYQDEFYMKLYVPDSDPDHDYLPCVLLSQGALRQFRWDARVQTVQLETVRAKLTPTATPPAFTGLEGGS